MDAIFPDSLPLYQAAARRDFDLIHTRLEVSFDWENRRLHGTAQLTLRPWFYPKSTLVLDAKNFDIHQVRLVGKSEDLKFQYDNAQITIDLGMVFTRQQEVKIMLVYTAKPEERTQFGGSDAIGSDKGLYFINADGKIAGKPRQVWTQGETESNSRWFPTIDKPNERCTQELYLTVSDSFKTLSNGLLISSKKNADGTRTDYWKMEKSHAPYLFMMAVGNFAVVQDKWRGREVNYYVEPAYESYARDIFPYTPVMLEFFSRRLGYDYPWSKYAQVVVRDYVSGAMENTTAVIFGEFVQRNRRALMDQHLVNEKIVAHEMFHHWFGDLVTTESWANLTLNEGFANYAEYLWLEYQYGREAADDHLVQEQAGYLFSVADGGHPLIHYGYVNREDMFDAHAYNKGGLVLHMLRSLVGDEAFFASLNKYLVDNAYSEVEAHELRLAFEEVTGMDLNWFWNQWYFSSGHPVLDIQYRWDDRAKQFSVEIEQQQEGVDVPRIFQLPMAIDIYSGDGGVRREPILMNQRKQTFTFNCLSRPVLAITDAENVVLGVRNDGHTEEEWAVMYQRAPKFRDRMEALEHLSAGVGPLAQLVKAAALGDVYYGLRAMALRAVDVSDTVAMGVVMRMAKNDPEPSVRQVALELLGQSGNRTYVPVLLSSLGVEQPYSVVGAALAGLYKLDPDTARAVAPGLENEESESITATLAQIYADRPEISHASFFNSKMDKIDYMGALDFFEHYGRFLTDLGQESMWVGGAERLFSISMDSAASTWRRYGATRTLVALKYAVRARGNSVLSERIAEYFESIMENEKDETLKSYYRMF